MATKIRLMRLGKMRSPHYRVVVTDSRTKRDGRSIETIGKYHPKEEPSFIEIDGERALHWLRVGAQPTEAVEALLKVTGTWQEFKGLPAPPPMKVKEPKADKKTVFEAAAKAAMSDEPAAATTPKAKKKVDEAAKPGTEPTADQAAAEAAEAPAAAETTPAEEPAAAEAPAAEAAREPAAEAAPEAASDAAPEAAAQDVTETPAGE
ncbi:MAG TPA: 30S ribosomal protein S16 [Mycobacteriales bacterium]